MTLPPCSYCIDSSEKSDEIGKRLELLSAFVTQFTFNNVSRGLFEEHKLLYAFMVATSLLRHPSRWVDVRGQAGMVACQQVR